MLIRDRHGVFPQRHMPLAAWCGPSAFTLRLEERWPGSGGLPSAPGIGGAPQAAALAATIAAGAVNGLAGLMDPAAGVRSVRAASAPDAVAYARASPERPAMTPPSRPPTCAKTC